MNRNPSIRICAEDAGECVLDYLTRRFTYQSRTRWETLIGNGKIRLNGRTPDADTLLRAADVLAYEGVDEVEPPVSSTLLEWTAPLPEDIGSLFPTAGQA